MPLLIYIPTVTEVAAPISFSTFTEIDPNNKITVNTNSILWATMARSESAYVYKDYGVDYFNADFTFQFECSFNNAGAVSYCNYLTLQNFIEDSRAVIVNSHDMIHFYQYDTEFRLALRESGSSTVDSSLTPSPGTTYYVTINRDDDGGTNNTGIVTATIRSGSHTGTLFDTLQVNCGIGAQNDFRYLYVFNSYNDGSAGDVEADGTMSNLIIT